MAAGIDWRQNEVLGWGFEALLGPQINFFLLAEPDYVAQSCHTPAPVHIPMY